MLKGPLSLRTWPAVICALLIAQHASAQGFGAVSGRNHPEINWLQASTEHFAIVYPDRLEGGIERVAAAIAESTYTVLSHNMGVTFDGPIRIYLSDEDEIGNGFAVPIANGWTNIWVNAGQLAADWTGQEKWLRKVIPHELAHIFHYRATRSSLGLLDNLFSDPLPRFWTEGLAQYQTENWDALRGDQWLRKAVLEDRLSYRDGRSIWNGRLLYAVGNSQVRYLASQYGDSTITKILAYRRPALVGLAHVHDFSDAFTSVTGKTYREFYDEWRRTVNVYYNTIAGQMSTIDSLDARRLRVPGQYLYDIKTTRNADTLFVLNLQSIDRPVRRIDLVDSTSRRSKQLAEGAIRPPISVSGDGKQLAFSRLGRGASGSLVHDLYLVDTRTGAETRLTRNRRADSPTFSPDGRRIAFTISAGGTSNVFVRDLTTGAERQLTFFDGGVQISQLAWNPVQELIAYYIFDADGRRRIEVVTVADGGITRITDGTHDDRRPIWSPDGTRIAFTSLRDDVPNVFVSTDSIDSPERVTGLATGATLVDWITSNSEAQELVVIVGDSKREDRAYTIAAAERSRSLAIEVPAGYAAWTRHRPPRTVPLHVDPAPNLIRNRASYSTWSNLTHAVSVGVPYYNHRNDWGLAGGTVWVEPLGKHLIAVAAGISMPAPVDHSFLLATYINNQFRPTIALGLSRLPDISRRYGPDTLYEDRNELVAEATWPVDWRPRPYLSTLIQARVRLLNLKPLNAGDFASEVDGLPTPESGSQVSARLAVIRKKLRPFRDNQIHPLDGWAMRTRVTLATRDADFARSYVRFEASGYRVIPVVERHRLFVYARFRAQGGQALPQDFIGLARHDALRIKPVPYVDFTYTGSDRVRGYRRDVVGARVLFASLEYRIPLVPSLRTQVLGIVSLGATTFAPYIDGGAVWVRPAGYDPVYQFGTGAEVKNSLQIFGSINLTHALGFGQPVELLGTDSGHEIYYKIQTALPF